MGSPAYHGEHLWGTDTHFADGREGEELWNKYPRLYTEAYYQFVTSKRETVTFSRAGFAGLQRSPLHWAGDENSTWDAFRHPFSPVYRQAFPAYRSGGGI
ncbi:MAG: hypothetical protein K8I82_10065 [Anaerolineae bacterium]|nr:hypothetical protein [Anaerolineae bacterium]